jgi:hypothetical protein
VALETECLNPPRILTLEPERAVAVGPRDYSALQRETMRSSCLSIQMLGVERFSFLPDLQRDGGDLARQCQPRHLRLHIFLQQSEGHAFRNRVGEMEVGGGPPPYATRILSR